MSIIYSTAMGNGSKGCKLFFFFIDCFLYKGYFECCIFSGCNLRLYDETSGNNASLSCANKIKQINNTKSNWHKSLRRGDGS